MESVLPALLGVVVSHEAEPTDMIHQLGKVSSIKHGYPVYTWEQDTEDESRREINHPRQPSFHWHSPDLLSWDDQNHLQVSSLQFLSNGFHERG